MILAALLLLPQDTAVHVAWSGFVDTYFAYDLGTPATFDRPFTTQAARHDEFIVNLAHVAVALSGDRVRGRLALQAGTSVQVNYAGEPSIGGYSGAALSRHIQEATAGTRVGEGLWLDAGIYFSYIGWEGWISRDNPTYTRSLVADYTPYYLSGVKLTWQRTGSPVTAQVDVMNGWQNISENNHSKAVGGRIDWQVTPALAVGYAHFIGNELPDSEPAKPRVFNQLLARYAAGRWLLQGQVDAGTQGGDGWWGWVVIARRALSSRAAISGRIEGYRDPHQVIVVTGTPNGFEAIGGSAGCDVALPGGALWRSEARILHASAPLFPGNGAADAARSDVLFVSSLALTF